jgi:hypothetical protein
MLARSLVETRLTSDPIVCLAASVADEEVNLGSIEFGEIRSPRLNSESAPEGLRLLSNSHTCSQFYLRCSQNPTGESILGF